jgi:hypothetical protein
MRQCGDCQLCCKLLPVRSMAKLAGERCSHQRHHKGCAVYAKLFSVAPECKLWNCRWLRDESTGELRRPDRSHYVIDVMPEYVTLHGEEGVPAVKVPVVQIWVDPNYPDAHRDPALRDWLEGLDGWAGLVRYSGHDGFVIFPPKLAHDGQWHEMRSNHPAEVTHTAGDLVREFGWGALGI